MSQYLTALGNQTDITIFLKNTETGTNDFELAAGKEARLDPPYNIPDNSDSASYFEAHHMEIQDEKGNVLFSFWDDDNDNYNIKYCNGTDWQSSTEYMPGYSNGGNNAKVGFIVYGTQQEGYDIEALPVLNNGTDNLEDNHVYVTNQLDEPIYVLAAPTEFWSALDIATDLILLAVPVFQEIKAMKTAYNVIESGRTIETLEDVYKVLEFITNFVKNAKDISNSTGKLISDFQKSSETIPQGEHKNVYSLSTFNKYTSASGWGGIFGYKTLDIVIMIGEGKKITKFNSSYNKQAWIVEEKGVVKAADGSFDVGNPLAGVISWNDGKGYLPNGSYKETCKDFKIVLKCQAKNDNGDYVNATYDLTGKSNLSLANINGVLINQGSTKRIGYRPGGSYIETCKDFTVTLTCQAKKEDEDYINAEYDLTDQYNIELVNNNGTLVLKS